MFQTKEIRYEFAIDSFYLKILFKQYLTASPILPNKFCDNLNLKGALGYLNMFRYWSFLNLDGE